MHIILLYAVFGRYHLARLRACKFDSYVRVTGLELVDQLGPTNVPGWRAPEAADDAGYRITVFRGVNCKDLNKKQIRKHQNSMEFYLYKISRVTGHSEYDVFCKSAEDWPVARISKEKIDADFKSYLGHNAVPPYVNHFVRENKHHIDELNLPRF